LSEPTIESIPLSNHESNLSMLDLSRGLFNI